MNIFLIRKLLVSAAASVLMIAAFSPLLHAQSWIFAIHGGSMEKKAGYKEMAFDPGFYLGVQALKSVKKIPRLSMGVEIDYRLMDGQETVKDPYGVYDASNSYTLADTSLFLRYALPPYKGVTLFSYLGPGLFWEKTEVRLYPRARTLSSRSWENSGLSWAFGGGAILFDHFELFGGFNQFEKNRLLTLSIGWLFNEPL